MRWSHTRVPALFQHLLRRGMRADDTVWTPPGEEHWHGGIDSNVMCHIAVLEGTDTGDGTTWLEPVTDQEYAAAHRG
jgi:hypothetical protein